MKWKLRSYQGIWGYTTPIMENQMEKQKATGLAQGYIRALYNVESASTMSFQNLKRRQFRTMLYIDCD